MLAVKGCARSMNVLVALVLFMSGLYLYDSVGLMLHRS